jgi:hypothetical protein
MDAVLDTKKMLDDAGITEQQPVFIDVHIDIFCYFGNFKWS